MSEPRRIDARNVGPTIGKKKERKNEPSYRFEVELRESTTDYFPEISFADLVEDRKKSEAPLDPGDNINMKEVEAIAKRMEEKYGGGSKRKRQVEDFCDLGEGYDDNDSFIDNAEAYDELVPSYLTTKLGGFYINSGSLDFKEVSHSASADGNGDDSSSEFQSGRKPKRSIKLVDSMSEDEELQVKKKATRRVQVSAESCEGDERPKKLGRPKKQKNKIMFEGDSEKGKRSETISENVARKYDSVIDDVINQYMQDDSSSEEPSLNGVGGTTATSEPSASKAQAAGVGIAVAVPPSSSAGSSLGFSDGSMPKELPKLPDCLSDSYLSQIDELKKVAECSSDGKQKFFSAEVNQMLLRLATNSRHLSGSQRKDVFTYLCCFLPVGRETLMKRVKLLTLKEEDSKLRAPLDKLKQAVEQAMPSLMDKYHIDSAAAAQALLDSREADAAAADKMRDEPTALSDDDDDRPADLQLTENGADKKAKNLTVRKKRKKFPWTDQLRMLLCAVVQLKMDSYLTTKTKGQLPEDFVKEFLEEEVKVFWPKGWMQTRVLYKESRTAHSQWTSQPVNKPKKPGLPGIARAADNTTVPQLRRAELEKAPAGSSSTAAGGAPTGSSSTAAGGAPIGSSSTAAGGADAPPAPRTTILDDDDDAEDSESLGGECASSSDEHPRKEDDCRDRNASAAGCYGEAHSVAGGNSNNSNSNVNNANGYKLAKQPASHAVVASSREAEQKLQPDASSRDAAACTASTPTSNPSGFVVAVSTVGNGPSGRPLAVGAINTVPARAAIFPALTAAVSKAATLDHQNAGVTVSTSVGASQSSGARSQGHLTVTSARPHSVPNAISILDTSKVAATSAGTIAAAKLAMLGDRGPSPGALPPTSVHSSAGKVMVKLSHGNYQRSAELQRHQQHDHAHAGTGAATIAVKRLPQQSEQVPLGTAITTNASDRDLGLEPSRGRLPSANHVVTTSLAPGSAAQHSAVNSPSTTLTGHANFQKKPSANLPVPSSGSPTFIKPESRPGPQGIPSSHETVQQQRPCALDGQTSGTSGVTASTVTSKSQTLWHQTTPRPPYIMQPPARQLTPQQQLLQQQRRQSVPLQQQQQSRIVQHRPALTPEQLALKEMQRQQQGHLTVDQIMKLASTSVQYSSSASSTASSSASLQQLPVPAKLKSAPQVQTVLSAVGQASNKLHQPWAINANSAHAGPVSESFCVPTQPTAKAGRLDTGTVVHGCTTSAPPISRSPIPTQRPTLMASHVVGSSSSISGHTGASFSSVDQAYLNSLPKKS